MSYILSALRKAEQEHQKEQGNIPVMFAPDFTVFPSNSSNYMPWHSKPFWFALGAITLIIMINVGMFTLTNMQDAMHIGTISKPQATVDTSLVPVQSVTMPKSLVAPTVIESEQSVPVISKPVIKQNTPLIGYVPTYAELSEDFRQEIPELELTGHLYSAKYPKARKVIINGIALREQQYISADLFVREIKPDGVVLNYKESMFHLGVEKIF